MSSVILNRMYGIEHCSYLELGIDDNKNFDSINAKTKFSVDVNGKASFTGTTDEFFNQLSPEEKFDIIFIDANHDYDFVLKDFNNAVKHAQKWILIHDMIPPSEELTVTSRCSDSYRLLSYFLKEENFEIYSTAENFGLTFIKMPAHQVNPSNSYRNLSYKEFIDFIAANYKLYSENELVDLFNNDRKLV